MIWNRLYGYYSNFDFKYQQGGAMFTPKRSMVIKNKKRRKRG